MKTLIIKFIPVAIVMVSVLYSCSEKEAIGPLNHDELEQYASASKGKPAHAGKPAHSGNTSREGTRTYQLFSNAVPYVDGTVTFIKFGSGAKINIDMNGTLKIDTHPAFIYNNTLFQGGARAITLTPVKGSSGKSSTTVTTLDNGTSITYEDLLVFNGHLKVHLDEPRMHVIFAEGDIGINARGI